MLPENNFSVRNLEEKNFEEDYKKGLVIIQEQDVRENVKSFSIIINAFPIRQFQHVSPRSTFLLFDDKRISYYFRRDSRFEYKIVFELPRTEKLIRAILTTVDKNFTEKSRANSINLDNRCLQRMCLSVSLMNLKGSQNENLFFHLELDFEKEDKDDTDDHVYR